MKSFAFLVLVVSACGGADSVAAPELGSGDHGPDSVTFTQIAAPEDRLQDPRDLAFNPLRPDELWIVSHEDDSVVIVHDASTDGRSAEYRKDGYALHFMAEPSSIAFGSAETTMGLPGTFATCGESRNTYNGQDPVGNDFMGPVLWSSDPTVFAAQDPNGLGSHLDMLHCSPLCMGIAHEAGNAYWVFAGLTNSIYWYDFGVDDGIGNDDHSDGRARQLVAGEVLYVPDVPSSLVFDELSGLVYIADTGHGRITALDPTTGAMGARLPEPEPMAEHVAIDGAVMVDVVPPGELGQPSGLELHDGLLYVSDAADGRILAFDLEGTLVNWLDTGLGAGALAGLAFGPDGRIYLVDRVGQRVLRIDP
jgi:hypothetical protein